VSDRSAVRRLALGRFLSSTGGGIAAVALSFFVYQRTNSALWLAGTLFFTFGVAGLLTPFAGKLADRYDRRRLMITSDLLSLATWSLLVFVRAPFLLAAIGFIATVVALPYWLAASASIPNLVDEADLAWANGLSSAAGSTSRLLGPALGGALFALGGPGLAFGVNAASFGASALITLSIRGRRFAAEPADEGQEFSGAFEGFRVIRADTILLWMTIAWTLMWFAMNIAFVADPPLARIFGVGPFGYGMIDTFFGAGALAGALLAARVIGGAERPWVVAGMLAVAAGWAMIAMTPWFALVLVASAATAAIDSIGEVAGTNIIQRRTADSVRGRVFAAQTSAGLGANMLGFIVVGPLVEALGPRAVYGLGAGVALIAALSFVIPTTRTRLRPSASPPARNAFDR
jgi:MFS family permease